jgi:hypothetical protein
LWTTPLALTMRALLSAVNKSETAEIRRRYQKAAPAADSGGKRYFSAVNHIRGD